MTTADSTQAHPLQGIVTAMLLAAMLVFTYTVVIGILNGVDLVDFDRKTLLSHVHAGTLGWITMGIFAASLWLFGAGEVSDRARRSARAHAILAIVTLPVFAFTFALTYGTARAILGTVALLTIIAFCVWTFRRVRSVQMTTPHLAFLAALVTSVTGGLLGVLLATEIARGWNVGSNLDGAHPATMVVGFLTPVGMALAEWGLRQGKLEPLTRLGVIQVGLPVVGSILLIAGIMLDIVPLPPLAALANLVGIGILVYRMWQPLRALSWVTPGAGRYASTALIWLIVSTLYINYLLGANEGDIDLVGFNELLALDHMMFIGVLTNAIFVLLLVLSGAASRFPKMDQVAFFGINIGLIGFAIGLMAEASPMIHSSTPIMGLCILLGMVLSAIALMDKREEAGAATPQSPRPASAG